MGRERDDFGKPQAPEQKKRARFERKRNPNNNPAGPLSPQNLVCREESVTRKASERGLFPRPAPSNSSNSSSMATNVAQKRNTSFNLNERSTTDKFIDAFLMPQEAKGGYKEFLDTVGLDTNRGLRSTTDELTMKFFEGTDCPPINPFPSYDSYSNKSAAATGGSITSISRSPGRYRGLSHSSWKRTSRSRWETSVAHQQLHLRLQ